jgi:hypothetical protein
MADNLLRNPGFEDGAYPFDPLGIVYIPKEWVFTFRDGPINQLPRQTVPWGRPNAGCLGLQQFPPHEHPIFFQQGSQMLWKTWQGKSYPQYITLSQTLTLTPGKHYRFTANVCPDMVTQYGGPQGKVFIDDPDAYAVRVLATSGGQTFSGKFKKTRQLPNDQYTPVSIDFTAPAAEVTVSVEAYGLFSIENNCFFMDNFSLVEIEAPRPTFTAPANNLLVNGSFEEGNAYPMNAEKTLNVPAGWLLEVTEGAPTAVLLNKSKATPAEQNRLFVIGNYAWRMGGGGARLWQSVTGLTPGQAYRARAVLLPDFTGATGAQANVRVQCGEQTYQTNLQALPVGQYQQLEVAFTAPANRAEVSLELRAHSGGAWVVDLVAVEKA